MAVRIQGTSQDDLISKLKDKKVVTSFRVEHIMKIVDRKDFCFSNSYLDAPQSIGYNTTISAPHMHAHSLEILKDKLVEGARVLDVGTGSGYFTTCMAVMVGETGYTVGIEHIQEINDIATTNIMKSNQSLLLSGRLKLIEGDGRLGYPEMAPYDAIHVGAAAPTVPQALLNQLNNGGYLLIPVGPSGGNQSLELYKKRNDGSIVKNCLLGVRFVPLTDKEKQVPLKTTTGTGQQISQELEAKKRRIKCLELQLNIKHQEHEDTVHDINQTWQQAKEKHQMTENMLRKELRDVNQELRDVNQELRDVNHELIDANQSLEQSRQTEQNLQANLQSMERNLTQQINRKEEIERDLRERLQNSIEALDNARTIKSSQCHWILSSEEILMTQDLLGKGGWGEVKVAYFRGLKVAAKCLHEVIISDYSLSVFLREMEMAARIRHPNLLQFIGATQPKEDYPIIIMELLPTSLRKELDKSPLTRTQTLKISRDVSTALNYLHLWKPFPMIHRDVSSSNVLLETSNCPGQWKAKLSDFGSANLVHQVSRTACPGCPAYSAPEAPYPDRHTPAMDVYSFGILVMEMILYRPPPTTVKERLTEVESIRWASFQPIVRSCIASDHTTRPSIGSILEELQSL